MKLPIADILIDPTVNIRDKLNKETVARYAEILEQLPPVDVFDDVAHILADGFHRIAAAEHRGWTEIEVTIHKGNRVAAERFSIEANATTGVPLNRTERNRAVQWYLDHTKLSQRKIAAVVGIGRITVANIGHARSLRASLPPDLATAPALTDTHLYRVASLPEADQEPMARRIVEEDLSEPETREIIKEAREKGVPAHTLVPSRVPIETVGETIREARNSGYLTLLRVIEYGSSLATQEPEEAFDEEIVSRSDIEDAARAIERIQGTLDKWLAAARMRLMRKMEVVG